MSTIEAKMAALAGGLRIEPHGMDGIAFGAEGIGTGGDVLEQPRDVPKVSLG